MRDRPAARTANSGTGGPSPTATRPPTMLQRAGTTLRAVLALVLGAAGVWLVRLSLLEFGDRWDSDSNDDILASNYYHLFAMTAVISLIVLGSAVMLWWRRDDPRRWLWFGAGAGLVLFVLPVAAAAAAQLAELDPRDKDFLPQAFPTFVLGVAVVVLYGVIFAASRFLHQRAVR
jgi:hypothetical protein